MRLPLFLLISLCLLINISNAQASKTDTIPAEYPGGINAFREYISKNMRYSVISLVKGINKGRIVVEFVVDTMGYIIQPKIVERIDKYYTQEIFRLLKESKPWKPGTIKGKRANLYYKLPIRLDGSQINLKNATVIFNGGTIPTHNLVNKLPSTFVPYYEYSLDFAKALLGNTQKFPLIFIQDFNEKPSLQKDLQTTLNNLKKIDTSKFHICIDHPDNSVPFDQWKNNLLVEKTVNVLLQHPKPYSNKFGTVILLTKNGENNYKQAHYKQQSDKNNFLNLIAQYRNNEIALPDKLIYIDNYHFQTRWIMDSLNTNIVQMATITEPESIRGVFEDDRKKGYIQLYTKNFTPNQDEVFKKQLKEIINDFKNFKIHKDQYLIFVNSSVSDLEELAELDFDSIVQIHILSLQTAKDLFGRKENRPIIYLILKVK